MPVQKLKRFLDENDVKYVSIIHSKAYTADMIAESAHISGKELAKTVMVKINDKMAMAVLPAAYSVDFDLFERILPGARIEIASEQEFADLFPDCEVGAMPPFGNLYGMDVYVDITLSNDEEIWFNAGTHTEIIKIPYVDFIRLANPQVVDFAANVFV